MVVPLSSFAPILSGLVQASNHIFVISTADQFSSRRTFMYQAGMVHPTLVCNSPQPG